MCKRMLAVILSFLILFSDVTCFFVNAEELSSENLQTGEIKQEENAGVLEVTEDDSDLPEGETLTEKEEVSDTDSASETEERGGLEEEETSDSGIEDEPEDPSVEKPEEGVVENTGSESVSGDSISGEIGGGQDVEEEMDDVSENMQLILDRSEMALQIGQSEQLKAEITPNIFEEDMVWTSDREDVVTVEDGLVTAVGVGKAIIRVAVEKYEVFAECIVEVTEIEENVEMELKLNYDELTMQVLSTDYLEAELAGELVEASEIVWGSSDADIVYVEDGEVAAFAVGEAVVTARMKDSELTASCTIKVVAGRKLMATRSGNGYNASAALSYASQYWNIDGYTKECAEFVSNCISAGGVPSNIWSKRATLLRELLNKSGFGNEYECSLSSDGYFYKRNAPSVIAPGDVVFYYCASCDNGQPYSIHVVLFNGFDSSGRMKAYSHNGPNNGAQAYLYKTKNGTAKCYDCGKTLSIVHVFHFDGNTGGAVNNTPQGWLDSITTSNGSVTIAGWAKDNDDPNRAVEIRMEVGGSTYITTANLYRGDVGSHGFNATFKVNCSGTQTVNVYAIDADVNQKVLLSDGSRTITIQRVMNLEYSTSQVEIPYQSSTRISFSFQGDGIARLDSGTGDGRIAKATLSNIDWTNGTGYVDISSGLYVGKTNFTIYFLDSNGNRMYQKSIPITVKGNFSIEFDTTINYIRQREEGTISFTVTGDGFSSLNYSSSDSSIAMGLGQIERNSATGKYSVTAHGFKEGTVQFNIELLDINNNKVYEKSCALRIMPRLNISMGNDPIVVSKDGRSTLDISYQGYGVSDVEVVSADMSIATASIKNISPTSGTATIVVLGNSLGKTKIYVRLLDYKGEKIYETSKEVTVQENFNVRFEDTTPYMWVGENARINFTFEENYSSFYGIQYIIEEGEDVIKVDTYGANGDFGRWISIKGLKSGTALFTVSFNGMQGEKEIILYEKSITIFVLEMNVSPAKKTSYVGENIQLSTYCDPVTPTSLSYTYKSSDNTVASVSSTGLVTTKKTGNAEITVTASDGKHSAVCQLSVIDKIVNVTGVTVSPTSREMNVGDTFALLVNVFPSNATNSVVSYASSNPAIAAVDEFGRVTAMGAGNAKITVTTKDGGKKAYCDLVVNPAVVASGKTGDLDWKITGEEGDYTLTISGQGEMADYDNPTRGTGAEWYQYRDDLKQLVLEEGITKIGEYAFAYCDSLLGTLELPQSLHTIGSAAFADCVAFSGTLELPKNLKSIGAGAFNSCKGFSGDLIIPDGIEEINDRTFYRCIGFDGILSIPKTVTTIGDSAFYECIGLSGHLVLPEGLTSIEPYAFTGCRQLEGSLVLPETINFIGGFAFQGCTGFTGDLTILSGIKSIREKTFYGCSGFNGKLTLPSSITSIGMSAFSNTGFSQSLTIPASVTKIYHSAFKNVAALQVYFEGEAPTYIKDQNNQDASFAPDINIYYNPKTEGWTTPEWHGYAATPISSENPVNIPVESITVKPKELYLQEGDSSRLQYNLMPENTTEKDVIWESSDEGIVTVDENGWVTAVAIGETQVTVSTKNGKYTDTCSVSVEEQGTQSMYIDFDENNTWIWLGGTGRIDFQYGGRGFAQMDAISYDTSIAKVRLGEKDSTLTEARASQTQSAKSWIEIDGVASGRTKIAIRLLDESGNLLYQKATDIVVADLELSEYYQEIKVGESYDRLQASMYPDMDVALDVSYTSSDETIATVSDTGIIYALKQGTAIITVTSTDGLISKKCDIVVYKEGGGEEQEPFITVEPKELYLQVGDSRRLQYKLTPESTTEKDVIWESSDEGIVTVDENGWVTAVAVGETQVTVSTKNGKYTDTCSVSVEEQETQSMYIDFDENNTWIWLGGTGRIDFQYGGRGFAQMDAISYDTSIAKVRLGEKNPTLVEGEAQQIQNLKSWIEIDGVAPGRTKIAVRLLDDSGNLLYQKATDIVVADLELSEYYQEIKVGESYDRLQVSTYPDMEVMLDVNYSSSDETVATVSDTGIIYAVKQGTAIITVASTDGLISKKCDIVVYEEGGEEYEPLPVPTANIKSGSTVEKGTEIILNYVGEEADIYYTTDGSVPTKASILYTRPIKILADTTIRAFAVKEGFKDSDDVMFTYTVRKELEPDYDWGDILLEDRPLSGKIPDGIWIAGVQDKPYTSKAILQSFRVYDGNRRLREKADYTVSYKNNTEAYVLNNMQNPSAEDTKKAPQIIVKTKGNYAGKQTVYFNITRLNIADTSEFYASNITTQYSKKKNAPVPTLTWNGKKLKLGTDFYVKEYETEKSNSGAFIGKNNENTIYNLTLVGKGNFAGERKITLTVFGTWVTAGTTGHPQVLMNQAKVTKIPDQLYTGKPLTWGQLKQNIGGDLAFQVTYRNRVLEENADYEIVDIWGNDKAGTATLVLRGLNDVSDRIGYSFVGDKEISFKIKGTNIKKAKVLGLEKSYAYTGTEIRPDVRLEGINVNDYTVEYQNNIEVGKASVIITGTNACIGIKKATFKISGYPMDGSDIKVNGGREEGLSAVYMKGGAKPKLTIRYGNRTLMEGRDYSLKFKNNTKIVSASAENAPMVTVIGKGDFSGSRTIRYSITMADITKGVSMIANDVVENQKANKYQTKITLRDSDGKILKAGTDYDQKSTQYYIMENGVERALTSQDRPIAGTIIIVKVRGKGNYGTGEVSATYRVLQPNKDISKGVFKIENQPYTGKPIELIRQDQFEVDKNGNIQAYIKTGKRHANLSLGKDFEVVKNSYSKNVNKGKATVILHGIGEYGGYKTVTFSVETRSISEWWKGISR